MAEVVTDQIIEEAMRMTGLSRFDSESFREGLDIMVADINRDEWQPEFRERSRLGLRQAVADRLQVTAALEARPELLQREVKAPLFVFGLPRTGTTLLSNLLAVDPARRPLLAWEIREPVPPPKADALMTDPRALAALEAERAMLAAQPEMGKYFRGSATFPDECVWVMAHDFKTLMWESRGKLPGYREWILQTDMRSAYDYHKKFLQLHQADAPGIWSLKMPSHSLWIPQLLQTYPDAKMIWTHRDPITATASLCSLISMGNRGAMGQPNIEWVGQYYPWQAAQHAERAMDARDAIGEARIVDFHYADMMRDPLGAVRKLYKALGDALSGEAEAAMQAWLDDNPQDKFGRHEYKLALFGLEKKDLDKLFERYLSRYDVESEG